MKDTNNKNRKRRVLRFAFILVFFMIVFVLSFAGISPSKLTYEEGDVATENILAPKRITNERLTEELRQQAENTTAPVYDYIPSAHANSNNKINIFFEGVSQLYTEYLDEEAVKNSNNIYSLKLTYDEYEYLIKLSGAEKEVLRRTAIAAMDEIFASNEVISSNMKEYKNTAGEFIDASPLNDMQKSIVKEVVENSLQPNMILNESATAIAREAARESVYEVVYEAGQTILNKGDVLTADDIQFLKDNNLMKTSLFERVSSSVGLPAQLLIVIVLFIGYVANYYPKIASSLKSNVIIALLAVIMLVAGQVSFQFSVYLMPAAVFTMSICLLFGARTAAQFNFFYILFLTVTLELDVDAIVYISVSSYVGIVYLRQIRTRADMIKAGMLVCLVNVAMVIIIGVLRTTIGANTLKDIAYAIGSGVISIVFTNALVLVWEGVFNVLTPFKLLEMSGANDEAIQRLVTQAPGTYHHSLIVSNLAETAAAAVGANPLLARVGAYYHDIGKAEKALYFSENQANKENILNNLSPEASAKIIKNHVTDGMYIAEKNNIPKEVSDFIDTHHGTSEITFFKIKAENQGYKGEEDFHYKGNLPMSKETSIVMLADSIEATVRSLDQPDSEKINEVIDKLIKKKINEGQLKKSKLTFSDIETVKQEFYEVLCSVYHARVKYPDAPDEENKND